MHHQDAADRCASLRTTRDARACHRLRTMGVLALDEDAAVHQRLDDSGDARGSHRSGGPVQPGSSARGRTRSGARDLVFTEPTAEAEIRERRASGGSPRSPPRVSPVLLSSKDRLPLSIPETDFLIAPHEVPPTGGRRRNQSQSSLSRMLDDQFSLWSLEQTRRTNVLPGQVANIEGSSPRKPSKPGTCTGNRAEGKSMTVFSHHRFSRRALLGPCRDSPASTATGYSPHFARPAPRGRGPCGCCRWKIRSSSPEGASAGVREGNRIKVELESLSYTRAPGASGVVPSSPTPPMLTSSLSIRCGRGSISTTDGLHR